MSASLRRLGLVVLPLALPLALSLAAASGCSPGAVTLGEPSTSPEGTPEEGTPEEGTPEGGPAVFPEPEPAPLPEGPLPFAPRDVDDFGLVNVDADLAAVLEDGALKTACAQYEQDPENARKRILCGKAMFFYEGFGTLGVPKPIFEFLSTELPEAGEAQVNFGLIRDPFAETPTPLGNGPGALYGNVETYAYTCAACHFGRLPDGRYAVGAPNHEYDYGLQTLSLFVMPLAAGSSFDASEHDPAALARVQPMLDRIANDSALKWRLRFDLLPLLFAGGANAAPDVTIEVEAAYASWKKGTMDFMMAPLPLDDNIHTVSKIISLWDIPSDEERARYGMVHENLAWTGGAEHLMGFLEGFVEIGGGSLDEWPRERLSPLHDYIRTLRAPVNAAPGSDDDLVRGEAIFFTETFTEEGGEPLRCVDCHDGPSGESTALYTYDEIGTDAAMAGWGAGTPIVEDIQLPFGLKAPRLSGVWSHRVFLHNGSLDTLEQLVCAEERGESLGEPFANTGHRFGCDTLDAADKRALLAFIRSL